MMSPGWRAPSWRSFLAKLRAGGQSFEIDLERRRLRLSPARSMRWACERGVRGWRRHKWGPRTRCNATIAGRLLPRIRVIDAVHLLFGQPLEVSPSRLIRRIGWMRVVLPDGRHRWVPQKATDLNVSACEARSNRDLPLVSVRTLIPLAEYVRARLSAVGERFDETSGHTADPAVRAGIA